MYISPRLLQVAAWSAIGVTVGQAQYLIDSLSFGHKDGSISPNLRGVPGWHVSGEGHEPEILSDRVILTPPWPGNKRGALWAESPVQQSEWQAELQFRASGPDRAGGNMQVWYTKDSQKDAGPSSVYTAPNFDGLVLLMDQYGGRGGTIRGFLNDGTVSYKDHHDVDQLSFGQCNYPYRNLGRLSKLQMKQTTDYFEVTVDGNPCFRTSHVRLPANYFFGISASSAETPDSFEAHHFLVSTTSANTREDPKGRPYMQPPPQNQQQQQQQTPQVQASHDIPAMLNDVLAGTIRSQEDQFADLHNRIQIMNHKLDNIFDLAHRIEERQAQQQQEMMNHQAPVRDQSNAMIRNIEKIERIVMAIQKDVEGKEFKGLLDELHSTIRGSHDSLTIGLPMAMNDIMSKSAPKWHVFLFVAIAVQVMILGGYVIYKRRRRNAPKKYL